MTEIGIPTVFDHMHPTLVAVRNMGGSATRPELLDKVPKIAGTTDEQLAVVFPDDSTHPGILQHTAGSEALAMRAGAGVREGKTREVSRIGPE